MDYNVELKKVVQKTKQVRLEKHLSVQELAYRCDMERSNMSRIEAGKTNVTLKTLCKICTALDLQWSDIFTKD